MFVVRTNTVGDEVISWNYSQRFNGEERLKDIDNLKSFSNFDPSYILTGTGFHPIVTRANAVLLIELNGFLGPVRDLALNIYAPGGDWKDYESFGKSSVVHGDYVFTIGTLKSDMEPTGWDFFLMCWNRVSNSVEYVKAWGGSGYDAAYEIIKHDGGLLIAGETNSYGNGNSDLFLMKLNYNGNPVWAKAYGFSGNEGYATSVDAAGMLISDPVAEDIIFAGNTDLNADDDILVVRTDFKGRMPSSCDIGQDIVFPALSRNYHVIQSPLFPPEGAIYALSTTNAFSNTSGIPDVIGCVDCGALRLGKELTQVSAPVVVNNTIYTNYLGEGLLQIFNVQGRQVAEGQLNGEQQFSLDVPSGLYVYTISGTGGTSSGQFSITR